MWLSSTSEIRTLDAKLAGEGGVEWHGGFKRMSKIRPEGEERIEGLGMWVV
jgi:hypothetical protein